MKYIPDQILLFFWIVTWETPFPPTFPPTIISKPWSIFLQKSKQAKIWTVGQFGKKLETACDFPMVQKAVIVFHKCKNWNCFILLIFQLELIKNELLKVLHSNTRNQLWIKPTLFFSRPILHLENDSNRRKYQCIFS